MNTVALLGRLTLSLAAVLAVVWLLARGVRRSGRGRNAELIDVLGRQQLSRNSSVAVIRVGEQALVVGITDAQVSVLGETDLDSALSVRDATNQAGRPRKKRSDNERSDNERPHKERPPRAARQSRRTSTQQPLAGPTDSPARTALSGSALSPQTWKQTLESLRDMTTRS